MIAEKGNQHGKEMNKGASFEMALMDLDMTRIQCMTMVGTSSNANVIG